MPILHTLYICREEAADIIKAATKQKGSGTLAAWEEEQNDVITCHLQLYLKGIYSALHVCLSVCYMSIQAL